MEQSSNTKEKIKKENEELKQKLKEQLVSLDDVSKNPSEMKPNILATFGEGKVQKIIFKGKTVIRPRLTLKGHSQKVYSLEWAQDKRHIVSASQDGRLIVWDALNGHKLNAIASAWTMSCSFAPDGRFVASGGMRNDITIFSLKEPEGSLVQTLRGHTGYISKLRHVDAKQILSSSGDETCALWDIENGIVKTSYEGHSKDVQSVAPFPSKNIFVTASTDQTAKIWDLRTKTAVQTYFDHTHDVNDAQFFPSGDAFATACDDSKIRLFDIRAGRLLNEYSDAEAKRGISSVTFSVGGRLLFSGHDDFICRAWDTVTGELLTTLNSHDDKVSCLHVCADGMALATGSWDSTLIVWA